MCTAWWVLSKSKLYPPPSYTISLYLSFSHSLPSPSLCLSLSVYLSSLRLYFCLSPTLFLSLSSVLLSNVYLHFCACTCSISTDNEQCVRGPVNSRCDLKSSCVCVCALALPFHKQRPKSVELFQWSVGLAPKSTSQDFAKTFTFCCLI